MRAVQILLHLQLRGFRCRVFVVARRQSEFLRNLLEILRCEGRPALHEGVVDRPELARHAEGILRQFRCAFGNATLSRRSMLSGVFLEDFRNHLIGARSFGFALEIQDDPVTKGGVRGLVDIRP